MRFPKMPSVNFPQALSVFFTLFTLNAAHGATGAIPTGLWKGESVKKQDQGTVNMSATWSCTDGKILHSETISTYPDGRKFAGTGMLAFAFKEDGSCALVPDPAAKCTWDGSKLELLFSDEDEDLMIRSKMELVFEEDGLHIKQLNTRIFKDEGNREEHDETVQDLKKVKP